MPKKENNKKENKKPEVNSVAPEELKKDLAPVNTEASADIVDEKQDPQTSSEEGAVDTTEQLSDSEYTIDAEAVAVDNSEDDEVPEGTEDAELVTQKAGNTFLRRLMDSNFIEYASYVIKERAIPDVDDGLKPVQRRILWSLIRMDDGKFHKVANVIGHTMQYHPHGDASIGDALVVLANKEFYIDKQGNFGNIMTGDPASAARYIECRLTPLSKEVLFNNDITEFIDSYDGRNREPVTLPAKVPSLLMLGAEGIAVGMSTKILPHNFKELIDAQIAILRNKKFEIFPDFRQGGIMDVSEYEEGNGKITLRAKIERDGRKLIIREIPASTTTESLIASIERAVGRNKMKLASINDYTTDKVEIEIVPMRGYDAEKALQALYTYTDCSVSISPNLIVICDGNPVQMTVSEVLRRNTEKLLDHLRRELEIELGKLQEKFHEKTLAQIFIENRIYKRIEDCKTDELVLSEVHAGLKKFRKMLKRDITDEDVGKLLALPIRRISLFDINKNKKDLDEILKQIDEVEKNLAQLNKYTINYLKAILKKYNIDLERKTEIETFDKIDRQAVALNNIVVGWDRKNCYIGTSIKSEERTRCNEYDHLLCIERDGTYKVINIPDKIFVGRLYYFGKYDKKQIYYIVYSEKKTGKYYVKQCTMGPFITDKEYNLCPKGCKLEIITTRANSIYEFKIDTKVKEKRTLEMNLSDAQTRSAKARGFMLNPKKILGFKFKGILEENPDLPEDPEEDQELLPLEKNTNDVQTPTEVQLPEEKELAEADEKIIEKKQNTKQLINEKKKTEKIPKIKKEEKSTSKKKTIPESSPGKSDTKKDKAKPEPEKKVSTKSESKQIEKPTVKKASEKNDNDDNDDDDDDDKKWGVQQPEFGF